MRSLLASLCFKKLKYISNKHNLLYLFVITLVISLCIQSVICAEKTVKRHQQKPNHGKHHHQHHAKHHKHHDKKEGNNALNINEFNSTLRQFNLTANSTVRKFKFKSRLTTTAGTYSLRRAAYNLAGRVVRIIGALGSANVLRALWALLQKINHPLKDRIFGTNPPVTKPSSDVISYPLQIPPLPEYQNTKNGLDPKLISMLMRRHIPLPVLKQLTIKIVLNPKSKLFHKYNGLSLNGIKSQTSKLTTESYQNHRDDNDLQSLLVGNNHIPILNHYGYNQQNLLDIKSLNNEDVFGKQELGKPEQVNYGNINHKKIQHLYYFNPTSHKLRWLKLLGNNLNCTHCDLCRRPYELFHKIGSFTKYKSKLHLLYEQRKEPHNKTVDTIENRMTLDDLLTRKSRPLSPEMEKLRQKYKVINKFKKIRETLLEHLKAEKSTRKIIALKKAYIDSLCMALGNRKCKAFDLLSDPKHMMLLKDIVPETLNLDKLVEHTFRTKKYNIPLIKWHEEKHAQL